MRMKTNETAVEALQNNPEPSLGGSSWISQHAHASPASTGVLVVRTNSGETESSYECLPSVLASFTTTA